MSVMMQAFYWDCPKHDDKQYAWWTHVKTKLPQLKKAGFTSIWLPPAHKAANIFGPSMGYDPYDYYDLGEYNQKGSIKTWFGSKEELIDLINTAHQLKIQVIADMVINHCSGADGEETNPISDKKQWTKFNSQSGKFQRDWECFHPCQYESWDNGVFSGMPDICHRNPKVYQEIMDLAKWMIEDIGFDGFRYDFVKGYGSWLIAAIQEYRYKKDGSAFKPFGVGENWSSEREIGTWLDEVNNWNDNPISAFDFPLRYLLKDICDVYKTSLKRLADEKLLSRKRPFEMVTFVDNHDFRDDEKPPIINDKLLAYAIILTHEGYPCVFWQDYFNYGLGIEGSPNGIAQLVHVHEMYATGMTKTLWADDDLYIMQRNGISYPNSGLIFVLNNRGDSWSGSWVETRWHNVSFKPIAWWSRKDLSKPKEQRVGNDGRGEFWAPPRGYAVYVPKV